VERVIVERALDDTLTSDAIHALSAQLAECMAQHRVRPLQTLLAHDGRRMVCDFAAPDAEAVRRVNRQGGVPARAIWTSTIHEAPPRPERSPDPLVVVERSFDTAVDFATVQAIEDAGAWCLDVHRVRFVRTYFARDRRRMLCLYRAPDAEAVRRTQQQMGLPFDAVWPAHLEVHPTP
jgi:hypothetical protein